MRARNDVTVAGVELAAALARLLPRIPRLKVPKARIWSPADGLIRLGVGAATEDVTADGVWRDMAETSAPFLRRALGRKPPAMVRLIFHDGVLALNNLTITATDVAPKASATSSQAVQAPADRVAGADLPLWTASASAPRRKATRTGSSPRTAASPAASADNPSHTATPPSATTSEPPALPAATNETPMPTAGLPPDQIKHPAPDAPPHAKEVPPIEGEVPASRQEPNWRQVAPGAPPIERDGSTLSSKPVSGADGDDAPSSSMRQGSFMKRVGLWVVLGGVLAGFAAYVVHAERAERRAEQQRRIAMAVTDLPPTVEDNWVQHATSSVQKLLSRNGGHYVLNRPNWPFAGEDAVVSPVSQGYAVNCGSVLMEITLAIGGAEVSVLGFDGRSAYGVAAPALEVNISSIAAQKLKRRLCLEIAHAVEVIGAR